MTRPFPGFGEFINSVTGGRTSSLPSAPGGGGYRTNPSVLNPRVSVEDEVGTPAYNAGLDILNALNLPDNLGADATFTWDINDAPPVDPHGYGSADAAERAGGPEVIQQTLAGALAWLQDLAVTDREGYNSLVQQLVLSGYLSAADARYGSYTTDVAGAFLNSVIDVHYINEHEQGGALTTWANHIDSLISGAEESGTLPGQETGPVRQDVLVDEATLRDAIDSAARSALGRKMNDAEEAQFIASFRGLEKGWNDQAWAARQGQPGTFTDTPSLTTVAGDFVDDRFAQEAAGQQVGAYMGVLRNLVGLGNAGIGGVI